MTPKLITGLVFGAVYAWLIFSKRYRATAVWLGVIALQAASLVLPEPVLRWRTLIEHDQTGWTAVNWNVIGIFAGTLLLAEAFIWSRVPARLSDLLIDRSPNICWAGVGVCALASVISIFVENVATVLIVAPIAMEMARKQNIPSAPFIIGIAVCSNLQGSATLIGDPPSMLLASEYRMTFNDFFWFHGRPGIFFAVQAGAVPGFAVLWLVFRRYRNPVAELLVEPAKSWFPTVLLVLMAIGLALASVIDPGFLWFGGALCVGLGLVALVWIRGCDRLAAAEVVRTFDWSTTFFLVGVFAMVRALENVGLIHDLAEAIGSVTGSGELSRFLIIVAFSVAVSAFVDNVPYLAVMLGVVKGLGASGSGSPSFLLPFGLLIGACIGGNITPIGASANIVACGLLRRREEEMSFTGFMRIGLPFTLAATAGAGLFLWLVWR